MKSQYLLVRAVLVALAWTAFSPVLRTCAFNNDGITDLVWRNSAADVTTAWFMQEIHWFDTNLVNIGSGNITGVPSINWQLVATADFNRDGQTDLLWRNPNVGNVIWLMNGTSFVSASTNLPPAIGADWTVVGTGDFDGDGYADILWRNQSLNYTYIWYLNQTTYVSSARITTVPAATWRATSVGDFDNDGRPDIVWQNDTFQRVAYWYMDNTTLLSYAYVTLYPGAPGYTNVTTGSFNLVGNSDLVWRATNGSTYIWEMQNNVWLKSDLLPTMPFPAWQIGGAGPDPSFVNNVVELSATAVSSRASLTLNWRLGDGLPVAVQRRIYNPANPPSWSTLQSNYRPPRLTNTDLTLGQRYEYKVGNEYLLTAINGTPVENRGKVILVVANYLTNSLLTDLETLHTNLVGDGWTVVRTNVPAHDDSSWANNTNGIFSIKNFITNTYTNSPTNNRPQAVILIGHVPVPHSGWPDADGHSARCLPADMYYGDVDGLWTDTTFIPCGLTALCNTPPAYDCSCGYCDPIRHDNLVGDGKWDQNTCPPNSGNISAYELAVGRIDFKNLPAFAQAPINMSETNLLQNYLRKDDRYRRKQTPALPERVMTGAYFSTNNQYGYNVVQQGVRIGSRLFGFAPGNIINGDAFFPSNSCTWAVMGGFGQPYHVNGYWYEFHAVTITNDTPQMGDRSFITSGNEPQGGFYCLYGSCFVDHFYQNNLMRALIASGGTDYNLGAMWFRGENHRLEFEQVALGETVGSSFLRTMNELGAGVYNTYQVWIGDPTLRVQILAPPTLLSGIRTNNNVALVWTNSTEAAQCFVYRSTSGLDAAFARITTNAPVSSGSYTDTNAPAGSMYMVRALNLKTTASGSYTNLSQGIFANP